MFRSLWYFPQIPINIFQMTFLLLREGALCISRGRVSVKSPFSICTWWRILGEMLVGRDQEKQVGQLSPRPYSPTNSALCALVSSSGRWKPGLYHLSPPLPALNTYYLWAQGPRTIPRTRVPAVTTHLLCRLIESTHFQGFNIRTFKTRWQQCWKSTRGSTNYFTLLF